MSHKKEEPSFVNIIFGLIVVIALVATWTYRLINPPRSTPTDPYALTAEERIIKRRMENDFARKWEQKKWEAIADGEYDPIKPEDRRDFYGR